MYANDQVWNIPYPDRRSKVPAMAYGLAWYAIFGLGAIASTFLNSLSSVLNWGPAGPYLAALPALVVNVALFTVSFRLLSPAVASLRALVPGAAVAGLIWTVLNGVGVGLTHRLAHANPLYGSFAGVLGLLAFIYLTARLTLYCAEANAVAAEGLWPRSLLTDTPSDADRRQLTSMARRENRNPEATVQVEV
jgi:membrane protein